MNPSTDSFWRYYEQRESERGMKNNNRYFHNYVIVMETPEDRYYFSDLTDVMGSKDVSEAHIYMSREEANREALALELIFSGFKFKVYNVFEVNHGQV